MNIVIHADSASRRLQKDSFNHHRRRQQTTAYIVVPTPLLLAAVTTFSFVIFPPVRHAVSSLYHKRHTFITTFTNLLMKHRNQLSIQINALRKQYHLSKNKKQSQPQLSVIDDIQSGLDRTRDRAVAQLENERIASNIDNNNSNNNDHDNSSLSDDEYAALPPLQRRELLASSFNHRFASAARRTAVLNNQSPQTTKSYESISLQQQYVQTQGRFWNNNKSNVKYQVNFDNQQKSKEKNQNQGGFNGSQQTFWQAVESVNGRAAALGFMLCLAREIGEPGHPSLFEQVVDVVVPIAQSTPPFLVAVCDRIADLLT